MAGRSALLMGASNGRKKVTRSNPLYFIHRADGQPIFMAAIGSTPFGDETEGFLIVTAATEI